ncbi:MAG: hypothetical protein LBJ01_06160 [Tannerella sp.]|jgi:hypothetical protein|nr:hypothetical protein [Tannerella sp.]
MMNGSGKKGPARVIAGDFRELCGWMRDWMFYRRQSVRMSLAIRLADMKQRAFNRQYHVMIMALPQGERLVSVSRQEMQAFKRKGWLPRKAGRLELERSVFYSTPLNRNNRSTGKERAAAREKYLRYACRYGRVFK